MRTKILSFFLLSLSTLGIAQSSSDYCVCDEEIPGYNYFVTDDQTTGSLVPNSSYEIFNFSEIRTAPPSFFAPPRTVVPTDLPPSFEIALENNSTSEILEEGLQESDSNEDNVSSSEGGAPLQKSRSVRSNKRKVVWTKRSGSVKNRIKRKKHQGRLKNKRKGKFKKYRGKCPYF